LKNGSGKIGKGLLPQGGPGPDVTISLSSNDMTDLMIGSLSPFDAYLSGRIEVDGNTRAAIKLEALASHIKAAYGTTGM